MFSSIAPVKRGASSAPHTVVADHSFMTASGCSGMRMCTCMREQQCRALSAYNNACFQDPKGECEGITSIPEVRLKLFYIQIRPTSSARSAAAGGRAVAIVYRVSVAWQEVG